MNSNFKIRKFTLFFTQTLVRSYITISLRFQKKSYLDTQNINNNFLKAYAIFSLKKAQNCFIQVHYHDEDDENDIANAVSFSLYVVDSSKNCIFRFGQ